MIDMRTTGLPLRQAQFPHAQEFAIYAVRLGVWSSAPYSSLWLQLRLVADGWIWGELCAETFWQGVA